MPWRIDPEDARCVQVEKDDGWERLSCHESEQEAQAHLAALNLNASEAGKGEPATLIEHHPKGWAFAEATVDADSGVIHDVSLLGRVSQNNRVYTEAALKQAAELHRGVNVYLDHPTESEAKERGGVRSVRDLAGRVLSARVVGDRVKGHVQALRGTEPGELLMALASQAPESAGFSHRASGVSHLDDDGQQVVESVTQVFGADVVSEPATVSGLFESIRNREGETMKIAELTLESLKKDRSDLVEAILAEAKDADKVATLEAENKRLREKVDAYEAKEAAEARQRLMDEMLEDAKLPKELVTEFFREQLEAAEDEDAVRRMIEDRKKLARHVRKGPPARQPEREAEGSALEEGGRKDRWSDEDIMETAATAFI